MISEIDLNGLSYAEINFDAKWAIESAYDYVQLEISEMVEIHGYHSVENIQILELIHMIMQRTNHYTMDIKTSGLMKV